MQTKFPETYESIRENKPFSFRDNLRRLILDSLAIIDGIRGIDEDLKKTRIQFLYIHHVFKDEEKKLDDLLMRLSYTHDFISYSEAINKILARSVDRPYIAFSSDDGLKTNLKAADIFMKYGIRACFFINPGITGETDYRVIKDFCESRIKMPPVEFLNWKDISLLLKMGHEIGSHTIDHINIAETPFEKTIEDCRKSFMILEKECGEAKHFAFPYGRFSFFNEEGRKAVFSSGYSSCASAERGCHINPLSDLSVDELCIRRDHILLDWDLRHILFFIAKNSRNADVKNNYFPYKQRI